ncbi:unnamed protein product [Protopolystoma xenopodis]|uniref:Uncharacterized protein n=1 Tax=Protopolystoma xenopodis TaxID=117903 RepID=A0A3S5A7W5_9PLAT|nr:unnamed protein product [Protopolystoma xenopodis]
MLLGWVQSQTRRIASTGRICAALVYDPVWPAADYRVYAEMTRLAGGLAGGAVVAEAVSGQASAAGWGSAAANTQDAGMVPDGTPCSNGVSLSAQHHLTLTGPQWR